MKKYKFNINETDYEVSIKNIVENIAEIEVNGVNYQVEMESRVKRSKTPFLCKNLQFRPLIHILQLLLPISRMRQKAAGL